MSAKIQARPNSSSHSIFHKALIEILIVNHLNKIGRTWEHFLFQGGYVESVSPKPKTSGKKIKPKKHVQASEFPQQGTSLVQTRSKTKASLSRQTEILVPILEFKRVYTEEKALFPLQESSPELPEEQVEATENQFSEIGEDQPETYEREIVNEPTLA